MNKIIYISFILLAIASCSPSINVELNHMKKRKAGHINNKNFKSSEVSMIGGVAKDELVIEKEHFVNSNLSNEEISNITTSASSSNDLTITLDSNPPSLVSKHYWSNSSTKLSKEDEDCEEIIRSNGVIIQAKIIEVGVTEIKYKKCDNPEGPTYSILKSDVFMIKYKNGDNDVFIEKKSSNSTDGSNESKAEPFSIVSLSTGITGLVLGLFISMGIGVFLGILGIIFGAISMKKVNADPKKYAKNSLKLAKAGLVTGIIITAICTTVLILLLL